MAEENKTPAKSESKATESKAPESKASTRRSAGEQETEETRRGETVTINSDDLTTTPPGDLVLDGRAVDRGEGMIPDPDFTPPADDPDAEAPLVMDPNTGRIDPDSGADRVSFVNTRVKYRDGRKILTDHLKGDEQLGDLQQDVSDNPDAENTQWRW